MGWRHALQHGTAPSLFSPQGFPGHSPTNYLQMMEHNGPAACAKRLNESRCVYAVPVCPQKIRPRELPLRHGNCDKDIGEGAGPHLATKVANSIIQLWIVRLVEATCKLDTHHICQGILYDLPVSSGSLRIAGQYVPSQSQLLRSRNTCKVFVGKVFLIQEKRQIASLSIRPYTRQHLSSPRLPGAPHVIPGLRQGFPEPSRIFLGRWGGAFRCNMQRMAPPLFPLVSPGLPQGWTGLSRVLPWLSRRRWGGAFRCNMQRMAPPVFLPLGSQGFLWAPKASPGLDRPPPGFPSAPHLFRE